MDSDIAVKVDGVSKNFHYTSQRSNSIKGVITGIFKEKENSKDIQHALKNVSFEVKKGEFFGIVGRNGSGKSTLLKMIAGIYQPNKGSLTVNGKLVPFIELGVGFNPDLTGKENVYLNGALLGFSKKEVAAMYDEIVEFAELEKFMDQKLKNYSSGMQVRLAFSMAVRAQADILLIDEVLAVGDADFQRKCFDYFKKLKKDKKTVIFVSHDMNAVREYCDRAVLINDSKLILDASADLVSQKYTQLFVTDNIQENSKGGKRWGTAAVKTSDLKVGVNSEKIVISQKITAHKNASVIVGIRIKDSSGKEVTGTNTKIEALGPVSLERGESLKIIWSVTNILSDGKYTIDPAILLTDGITVCDWWNEAGQFTVKKDRHIPYIVDPGFRIEIERRS